MIYFSTHAQGPWSPEGFTSLCLHHPLRTFCFKSVFYLLTYLLTYLLIIAFVDDFSSLISIWLNGVVSVDVLRRLET